MLIKIQSALVKATQFEKDYSMKFAKQTKRHDNSA